MRLSLRLSLTTQSRLDGRKITKWHNKAKANKPRTVSTTNILVFYAENEVLSVLKSWDVENEIFHVTMIQTEIVNDFGR